jgi:glycine oxidase
MVASQISAGKQAYDVVVVGAGVIGLAVGWQSAARGLRTLVLDAESPGRGSTGAAAGMLAPVSEATFGEEDLINLNLEAARRYPRFVSELESTTGVATHHRPCGTLTVALDRDDAELLRRLHGFQLSLGLDAAWLRGRDCRALEPALSPRVVAGIRSPLDHQIDPRALALALAEALARSGGELRENAAVEAVITDSGATRGVLLRSGERISAEQVVVAAGWRSGEIGGLPEAARVPVRPVKGQILRLRGEPGAPLARRVIGTP